MPVRENAMTNAAAGIYSHVNTCNEELQMTCDLPIIPLHNRRIHHSCRHASSRHSFMGINRMSAMSIVPAAMNGGAGTPSPLSQAAFLPP
jgi:hypothetical protein